MIHKTANFGEEIHVYTTRQYLMKNVLIRTRKKIHVGVLTFCEILIIAYFLHISKLSFFNKILNVLPIL